MAKRRDATSLHPSQANSHKRRKITNTVTDMNTKSLTPVGECRIRHDESAIVEDVYWVKVAGDRPHPGKIQAIWRTAKDRYKISVMWYTKVAPEEWSIAQHEYVVTEDTDVVPVESLANKASILDWEAYNQEENKGQHLFHRMKRVKGGDEGDPGAYRYTRTTECHEPSSDEEELLMERLFCACGCEKHLILDEGYAYCGGCKRSTQDAHLGQPNQYVLVENGFIYLVDKDSGNRQPANCKCNAHLRTKTTTYRFGPLSMDPSLPSLNIACDAGTKDFRVLCKIGKRELSTQYPSCVFIPKRLSVTGEKPLLAIGENKPGEEGEVIVPLKRLIFPDKRTETTLSEAGLDGSQVFAKSIRTLIDRFLNDELAQDIPRLFDDYYVTISTAYPCCLDSKQKSMYLTALRGSQLRARIVAAPEPVAAVYAILKANDLAPGLYTTFDVGATTLDGTVVSITHDKKIVVHSAFGVDIGADFPEMRTAEHLLAEIKGKNLIECLNAARTYGKDIKQPNTGAEAPNPVRFGLSIQQPYDQYSEEYYNLVRSNLEVELKKVEHAKARDSRSILLCGGGAQSLKLQETIKVILPNKPMHLFDASAKHSKVLNGCLQKLDPKYDIQYSPVTICLECDKARSGTELMVIVLTNQALDGPKLLDTQLKPGQLIVLDTKLGVTDAKLTIKGRYGPTITTVNARGRLIVDPTADLAKQSFYSIGEIYISKDAWSTGGKPQIKSALTLLSVQVDINGSVVLCDTYLIKRPKTEKLIDEIERLTIPELKRRPNDYTIIAEHEFAGSLDLHEIKERAADDGRKS